MDEKYNIYIDAGIGVGRSIINGATIEVCNILLSRFCGLVIIGEVPIYSPFSAV